MLAIDEDIIATLDEPVVLQAEAADFWRKEAPLFDSSRQLTRLGMFPSQRRWWELPNFIKVFVGGYGSGKTSINARRAIASALENAPCPVAVVSPTFAMARETTIQTIHEMLNGKQSVLGSRAFSYTYNKTFHSFIVRYRGRLGRILIYSGENPNSLKGPNLGAAYIDEPFIQHVDVFKQMLARVRHPQAKVREIGLTGTPEQLNWGYDLCIGEAEQKYDVGVIQTSTRENLALPEAYLTTLERAFSEKEAQAYVDGNFVQLAVGQVFHAFDPLIHRCSGDMPPLYDKLPNTPLTIDGEIVRIPNGAELGAGMDFNVNPMSAAVFWRLNNHIHFFDEIELPNSDTEEMCKELIRKYGSRLRVIYPDPSGNSRATSTPGGKTDFWWIRQLGFSIEAPPESYGRRDSFNAVNGKLKSRAGFCTLTFAHRCKKLVKYLSTYTWELMNKQKSMSHLLDAFRYPVTRLFPVMKPQLAVTKLQGA